jgi:hypothetical protein
MSEDGSEERNPIDPEDFETLELTLEEARRKYEEEESRRGAVEQKIGIVVTIDALIVSVNGIYSELTPILLFISTIPALVSAALGLWTIRSQKYVKPAKEIEDFYAYAEMSVAEQREQLLLDYINATAKNITTNDIKFTNYNRCGFLAILSLFYTVGFAICTRIGLFPIPL